MSHNCLKVACVQMISSTKVDENLATARKWVAQAASAGAALVVLPEYFCLMGQNEQDKVHIAEELGVGPIQTALSKMALDYKIYVVAGSIALKSPIESKVYNSLMVYDTEGCLVNRYDKIHLFGFEGKQESYQESNSIVAGSQMNKFDALGQSFATGICYDLRFPELFRALLPFNILILPAAFTATTGQAHWEVLLRARAIENQCFVLASGQGGLHENGRATHGQTMIIDPWGSILAQQMQGEGLVLADLDFDFQKDVQSRLPALQHRTL